MNSSEGVPVILANRYDGYQQLEGDCACPIPPPKGGSVSNVNTTIWKAATRVEAGDQESAFEILLNALELGDSAFSNVSSSVTRKIADQMIFQPKQVIQICSLSCSIHVLDSRVGGLNPVQGSLHLRLIHCEERCILHTKVRILVAINAKAMATPQQIDISKQLLMFARFLT